MRGQPLESAKKALITVVKELPKSVFFDVVMFDQTAMAWQPRLVPDTAAKKQDAARVVIARGTKGGTASHAALNAIFGLGPNEIVNSSSSIHRTQRVSIQTIGVVNHRRGGVGMTLLMQSLARNNDGTFQLVHSSFRRIDC